MADSAEADEIFWVDPRKRGILPLHGFHLSRSLKRRILKGGYQIRIDHAFVAVVDACAAREETWINDTIRGLYIGLNRMGHAHSVEVWIDGQLAGGLYGVRLGGAFFGESMFSKTVQDRAGLSGGAAEEGWFHPARHPIHYPASGGAGRAQRAQGALP
jgi:leucyl/phenylalanyl-tRNA--protein transferase